MSYGIIGTGAIGGYYGAMLAKAGNEVHFLFHKDYEYVKQHGLQVDSCNGDFHLHDVRAYAHTSEMPQCDVVLVCLKTVNNHLLTSLLPPLLHPETVVVLIQNGIGVEADVQKMFPEVHLAAGLAFICSAKTEPGRVSHQCYGSINLANYSCDDTTLQAVRDDLLKAGVEARLVEYHEARWKKAVWNMPFNGMTVALHTETDKLLSNPHTRRLIREQMMEVVGVARQLGVKNVDEEFVEKMLVTTDAMVPYSPSMRLDYDNHRRMEIQAIYSNPIKMAKAAGVHMHKVEIIEASNNLLKPAAI